jgi:hypothetical protein
MEWDNGIILSDEAVPLITDSTRIPIQQSGAVARYQAMPSDVTARSM